MPIIAAFMGIGHLIWPRLPLHWLLLAAWLAFLPLVPTEFRSSREMFMHSDRYFNHEGRSLGAAAESSAGPCALIMMPFARRIRR
jgi:hypothetical protein